jgi:signal transduction histidine kinase
MRSTPGAIPRSAQQQRYLFRLSKVFHTLSSRLRAPRDSPTLALALASLLAISAIDYLVVPWPYVATPLYAIPVLIASQRLSPRAIGAVAALATALSVVSCIVQRPPALVAAFDILGLLLTDWLAALLAIHRRDAELARRRMQEITGFVTHDLRTPLTSIKGYAQMLDRQVRHRETPERDVLLDELAGIGAAADQMAALVDEILDTARLQEGQPLTLGRQPTDLAQLVANSVSGWQQLTQHHALRLQVEAPQLVGVWDPQRLQRVLNNVLSNAIKYSPGGGTITIRVTHAIEEAERWAVLTVQDEGQGIPRSDLPHVFERFHRGANVSGRIAGTGLGLAGAQLIVEQHGGTIALVSEEGKGSTATIRLPLASEQPSAVLANPPI